MNTPTRPRICVVSGCGDRPVCRGRCNAHHLAWRRAQKPKLDRETAPLGRWVHAAACRGRDPELWFPFGDVGTAHQGQIAEAKSVCAACPVRDMCLAWAVEALPYGIAGGLTATERGRLRVARVVRVGVSV